MYNPFNTGSLAGNRPGRSHKSRGVRAMYTHADEDDVKFNSKLSIGDTIRAHFKFNQHKAQYRNDGLDMDRQILARTKRTMRCCRNLINLGRGGYGNV